MPRAKKKQATPFDPIVLPTLMDSRAAAESVLEQPFEQVAVASLIVPEFMSELLPVIDDQPGVALKPEFSDKASGAELTVVQQQTVVPEGVVKTETTETHEVVEDGKVVVGKVLAINASFDHRFIDGYHASILSKRVRRWRWWETWRSASS